MKQYQKEIEDLKRMLEDEEDEEEEEEEEEEEADEEDEEGEEEKADSSKERKVTFLIFNCFVSLYSNSDIFLILIYL